MFWNIKLPPRMIMSNSYQPWGSDRSWEWSPSGPPEVWRFPLKGRCVWRCALWRWGFRCCHQSPSWSWCRHCSGTGWGRGGWRRRRLLGSGWSSDRSCLHRWLETVISWMELDLKVKKEASLGDLPKEKRVKLTFLSFALRGRRPPVMVKTVEA